MTASLEDLAADPLTGHLLTRTINVDPRLEAFLTAARAHLLRIDEARRLLTETRMDITSIAIELGFSSSQHFASRFKNLTGRTPSDYRCEGEGPGEQLMG